MVAVLRIPQYRVGEVELRLDRVLPCLVLSCLTLLAESCVLSCLVLSCRGDVVFVAMPSAWCRRIGGAIVVHHGS